MSRTPIVWALVLVTVACAACGGSDRRRVVVYSPHGKELLSAFEDGFESSHPDVDIQWIDMGGQDAYDRVRTEAANPQASMWWGGAEATFARAADEGLLEPYTPSWSDHAPIDSRDAENRWYGTFYTPEVIAYNSAALSASEAPQDWDELLQPAWKGRILIRYPLASSTMRTIFGSMILRQPTVDEGFAWLAGLDANVKTYTADPTQLYLRLARGEGDITLWNLTDVKLQAERNGYPFDFVIPESGTPVLTDAIALVKNGRNPEDARAFYEFVTSDSALVVQAHEFFRLPVRSDIDPGRLPDWIRDTRIKRMPVDWDRLREEGPGWMMHWDEHIKGRGANFLARR